MKKVLFIAFLFINVSTYSQELFVMTEPASNMPAKSFGIRNMNAFWGGMINSGISAITLKTVEVWGNDDLITEEGLLEIITKDKVVVVDKGKYIVLWKKEDGKWKMHRDISNSNLPAVTK